MLSKKFRLTREEIGQLKIKKSFIFQGRFFGLIYKKFAGERKFALILSNKISPKASKRNEIKRLFFRAIAEKPFLQEGKFLFLAKKSVLNGNLEEFKKEMEEFAKKLGQYGK